MSSVEEIAAAILKLPDAEFRRLADWLREIAEHRWDVEFEADAAAGRLDAVADRALENHKAGNSIDGLVRPASASADEWTTEDDEILREIYESRKHDTRR